MRLVDDDQVIGPRRGSASVRVVEHSVDHRLDGSHLNPVGGLGELPREIGHGEDLVELQETAGVGGAHCVQGLAAQRVAVDQEQDATKAFAAQQLVHQSDGQPRLARTGGHGEQDAALARSQSRLDRRDRLVLVGAKAGDAQLALCRGVMIKGGLFQAFLQILGRKPFGQGARVSSARPGVPEPDARLGGELLHVRPPVGHEEERNPELVHTLEPWPAGQGFVECQPDPQSIALGLSEAPRNVGDRALRLDDAHATAV